MVKATYKTYSDYGISIQKIRERITCNDGFSMSVQASEYHYCEPRKALPNGNYSLVEIGFPSCEEELLAEYAENEFNLTESVYGYVPIEIVNQVIEKHGGIRKETSFETNKN